MATVADAPPHAAPASDRGRSRLLLAAAVSGLVAVVCGVLLPFAPVLVDEPVVEWPRPDGAASTLLPLTAGRPLEIDASFSCATVAATGPDRVVLSTVAPFAPEAARDGLLVTAPDGRLEIRAAGALVLAEPLPAGPCTYRITGHDAGLPALARVPPRPATAFDPEVPRIGPEPDPSRFARPGDAELVVTRDGVELARVAPAQLPQVDAIATSSTVPPSVRMRLDDEFTSRPTPLKTALLATLVLALAATGALLLAAARGTSGERATPRLTRADLAADAVVGGVLVTWLLVAPATDDDGWFGTQARDGADGIRSYFQLYDYSFTPFTWPYEALHRWQEFAGTAPAVQRVPALVAGMLTWIVVRRLVAAAVHEWDGRVRARTPAVAAVAFLAWWLPFGMGVRPEALVALAGAGVLLGVLVAHRRSSAVAAWGACAVAGAGVVTHPAGVVALAPLVAGAGLLWRVVRTDADGWTSAARALAVLSGLATAPLLGFGDGALRDVLRTELLVGSVRTLEGWADEGQRYAFLLDAIPMGNYARRAAVLATLLALLACAVLAVAAAVRRLALPVTLRLAAASTAVSLVALAVTPSKWTHHFGGLAGVGAVLLAGTLLLAVPIARLLVARPPRWLVAVSAAAAAATLGLAWHGPNAWSYAWLAGMASAYVPPQIAGITLGDPLVWLVATVAVAALLVGLGRMGPVRVGPVRLGPAEQRRRDPRWAGLAAVSAVVAASLATSVAFAVTTFAAGRPSDSLSARTAADPTGCGLADAVRVLDPFAATPLAAGAGEMATDAFVPAGFVPGYGPQGVAGEVWGSFVARDGRSPDDAVGRISTRWFTLPAAGSVIVTAAGSLGEGNSLTAVYGAGGTALPGTQSLVDTARSPAWRTFVLLPPPGADSVRIDAVDDATGVNGWLAFTTPAAAPVVTVQDLVPAGEPVAIGWQLAFGFPCQRPPTLADGITEPPRFAVLRGSGPLGGLYGVGFDSAEGGAFAHVRHTGPVLRLATVGPGDPYVHVYAFGPELAGDGYVLSTTEREQPGGRVR